VLAAALMTSLGAILLSGAGRAQAAPQVSPRPLPVAANTLASSPDAFYGQIVSITAAVDRVLSASAFVIDQNRSGSGPHEVLVIAPVLTAPVVPNAYLTVVGEVLRFDTSEIARRAKDGALDLPPDAMARYQGRPAILATAVVNAAMVDLARRVPPPLSPEEEAFDKVMKRIGPAFDGLRTAMAGSDAAAAAGHATALKAAFADAESFWKARARADALEWTRNTRAHLTTLEKAAGAGNWDQVKTSVADVNRLCTACHTSYRVRLDDGTFRLRGQ
jgi:hypothetical protein